MPSDDYFLDEEERKSNEIKEKNISTYEKLKLYLNVKDYNDLDLTKKEKELIKNADNAYLEKTEIIMGKLFEDEDLNEDYKINKVSDVKYDLGRAIKYLSAGREITQENVKNVLSIYKQGKEEYNRVSFGKWLVSFISPFKNEVREMRKSLNKSVEFLKTKGIRKDQIDDYVQDETISLSDFKKYDGFEPYLTSKGYIQNADILLRPSAPEGKNAETISDKELSELGQSHYHGLSVYENKSYYTDEEKEYFKLIQKLNSNFFGKDELDEIVSEEEFTNELKSKGILVENESLEENLDKELEDLQDANEKINTSYQVEDDNNIDYGENSFYSEEDNDLEKEQDENVDKLNLENDAILEEDINFIEDEPDDLNNLEIKELVEDIPSDNLDEEPSL